MKHRCHRNVCSIKKLLGIIDTHSNENLGKPLLIWFESNFVLDHFKVLLRNQYKGAHWMTGLEQEASSASIHICHRYVDQMNTIALADCVKLAKRNNLVIYLANEYSRNQCPSWVDDEFLQIDLKVRSAIVLNHMFTGNYLNENIGHEIINLFSADNERQYIYLCKDGKYGREDILVEHVVQVRRPDKTLNTLEVINIASNLRAYNKERDGEPLYGEVSVSDIFKHNGSQQDTCVTFVAGSMSIPKRPLIIRTSKIDDSALPEDVLLRGYSPSQQLREYVYEELDESGRPIPDSNYFRLKRLITGWETTEEAKLPRVNDIKHNTSVCMAEIYGVMGRELSFSDAFKYFIEKYPNLFLEFSSRKGWLLSPKEKLESVRREWKNIDLLVKCNTQWFVIENKIFSGLNGIDGNQLEKYKKEVEKEVVSERIAKATYILLHPNHNNIALGEEYKEWNVVKYSEVYDFLWSKKELLRDAEMDDFLKALEIHSQVDFNFSIMHRRFVRAIKLSKLYNKENAENPVKE